MLARFAFVACYSCSYIVRVPIEWQMIDSFWLRLTRPVHALGLLECVVSLFHFRL